MKLSKHNVARVIVALVSLAAIAYVGLWAYGKVTAKSTDNYVTPLTMSNVNQVLAPTPNGKQQPLVLIEICAAGSWECNLQTPQLNLFAKEAKGEVKVYSLDPATQSTLYYELKQSLDQWISQASQGQESSVPQAFPMLTLWEVSEQFNSGSESQNPTTGAVSVSGPAPAAEASPVNITNGTMTAANIGQWITQTIESAQQSASSSSSSGSSSSSSTGSSSSSSSSKSSTSAGKK